MMKCMRDNKGAGWRGQWVIRLEILAEAASTAAAVSVRIGT